MLVTRFMEEGSNMVERLTMTLKIGVYEAEIDQINADVFMLIVSSKNDSNTRSSVRNKEGESSRTNDDSNLTIKIQAIPVETSTAEVSKIHDLKQAVTKEEEDLILAEKLDSKGYKFDEIMN